MVFLFFFLIKEQPSGLPPEAMKDDRRIMLSVVTDGIPTSTQSKPKDEFMQDRCGDRWGPMWGTGGAPRGHGETLNGSPKHGETRENEA